jgi:RsiW-degrading membrane proteinase PrsW (M82 family)
MGVLFFLIAISSIPAIAVFIWFHFARYPFSLPKMVVFLLAGAASFFPALFLQSIVAASNTIFRMAEKWGPMGEIFVRIALTEELSRLIVLSIMFFVIRHLKQDTLPEESAVTMASAAGLIAGLGFAIIESAVYGASNPGNALLRAFTSAPLHGACGSRVGSSIAIFRKYPIQGFFRFLFAVATHGIYNFMLVIPGKLSTVIAILIALTALASSVLAIRSGMTQSDSNETP